MRYHEVAERLLAASRADHTVVIVSATSSLNTRWARSELTTNGHAETADATVVAFHDGPAGAQVASIARPLVGLDEQALCDEALTQAKLSPPAWDAEPLPDRTSAPAGSWAAPPAPMASAELGPALAQLGVEMATDASAAMEHFGYLEHARTSTWLATSAGLALRHDQPEARMEMTVKSHRRSRSTWQGFSGNDLGDVDIPGMADRARLELSWQERRLDVAPGRRTAILSPSAVADLMIDLLYGADARAAAEGRSAFSRPDGGTAIGGSLSQRPLRLYSDPAMPGRQGAPFLLAAMSHDSASVFDNGLGLQPTDWVADGKLAALVSSRAVARRTGVPLALQPDNLALTAAGTGGLDDLVARTQDGLLITTTWYNRMLDPQQHLITGLTRDGVYLVRGGEVAGAVGNFRFNESPVQLLGRIQDAATPVPALGREMADYFTRTTMPALAVADFNFASASEAI